MVAKAKETGMHICRVIGIATEQIEHMFLAAKQQGIPRPAILVLDLDDSLARIIVRTADREAEAEAFIAQARRLQGAPITTWSMPDDLVARLLRPFSPSVADAVACVPTNEHSEHISVAVITRGVAVHMLLDPPDE